MEKRKLPKGNEELSVVGLGMAGLMAAEVPEIETVTARALINGINFFDCAFGAKKIVKPFAKVIAPLRSNVYLQMHFGAVFEENGDYGWSRSLDKIRETVDYELNELKTGYMDFGMVHCVDEPEDYELLKKNGVIKYIERLKKSKVVRHIGFSSHSPKVASQLIDELEPDIMMFSINPAYDCGCGDEYGIGSFEERKALYAKCAEKGVGISVMKPFFGGKLLSEETSPFKKKLSPLQCIQYALDRPAVLSTLCGVQNNAQLNDVLKYAVSSSEDRDYSLLAGLSAESLNGICVYCNHCQPCPAGLDIAQINRYYDLALAGDTLAVGHYGKLAKKASECTGCGHCNKRCPFGADQKARMREIKEYFGE